jgi:hypothetical protein
LVSLTFLHRRGSLRQAQGSAANAQRLAEKCSCKQIDPIGDVEVLTLCWFELFCIRASDTPLAIGCNQVLSLRSVAAALGKDLSPMIASFSREIYSVFWGCVALTIETLTPSALLGEESPGLSGSDLLETLGGGVLHSAVANVSRPFGVGLIGNH